MSKAASGNGRVTSADPQLGSDLAGYGNLGSRYFRDTSPGIDWTSERSATGSLHRHPGNTGSAQRSEGIQTHWKWRYYSIGISAVLFAGGLAITLTEALQK